MLSLETGLFDQFLGLPLHPLVVHFAVVLLPLAALALVLEVMSTKLADRYAGLTLVVLTVGAGMTFLAKESGEGLAAQVGNPGVHATVGDVLPWAAGGLWLVALVWYLLRVRQKGETQGAAVKVIGVVVAVLALLVTGGTIAVGHSGAVAVWAGTETPVEPTQSPTPSPTQSSAAPSASPTESSSASGYTLAEVATHADATSCWTALNGNVYDLTKWISQHPGGQDAILTLCGKDGTAAFNRQHGGQAKPEQELSEFLLGPLK